MAPAVRAQSFPPFGLLRLPRFPSRLAWRADYGSRCFRLHRRLSKPTFCAPILCEVFLGRYYRTDGVEAFIRKYGYVDKKGREDRLNFGGVFRAGKFHEGTRLTMQMNGYDASSGKFTGAARSIALIDGAGNAAAEWSFAHLMQIWNRKHAQAVYVPALARQEP